MPDPSADFDSPRTPPDAAASGERFEILRPLGRGAFGRTLLALDHRSNERRALKLLDPTTADDWKARELFSREATVLGALRHRGIPGVFDVVEVPWEGAPTPAPALHALHALLATLATPAPRPLDAMAKSTLRQIAPSAWQYMDSSRKRTDRVSAMEWLGYGALSVATLGILPWEPGDMVHVLYIADDQHDSVIIGD